MPEPPRRPTSGAESAARRRTPDVRGALIAAAALVLERDGLAGLTVRAVAAEAGVAPMGIYNHLGGKAGLTTAVLGDAFDELADATRWRADLSPQEALHDLAWGYRRFALERPVVYGLMFGVTSQVEKPAEQAGEHADRAFDGLEHAVRLGQQLGIIAPGDPALIATTIWSALHGAVSLEIARATPPHISSRDAFASVIRLIERGLTP